MDDLAYLVPESAKAWLDGQGDGRFQSYERYYRRASNRCKDDLDVEDLNEKYETYARDRARASAVKIGNLLVVMTALWFGLYLLGKMVVSGSDVAPRTTSAIMLAGMVAYKIHQRRSRAGTRKRGSVTAR